METAKVGAPAPSRCLDCPAPATHGLVYTRQGLYRGVRVPHGARWCKTHSIEAAQRRNAPPQPAGQEEA
jgi:hypothetical protein